MNIYTTCRTLLIALVASVISLSAYAENPRVAIDTNFGVIEIELTPKLAPRTVENFLSLVDDEFYNGLVFHRVIANFMIQAGGYNADLQYKQAAKTVPNESFNGVKNTRGTIAMARLNDPDSANSQFFINVADNPNLNADGSKAGYTVFGKVSAGMDVVDAIELVNTHLRRGMAAVPEEPVIINSITRVE
ncbi:MAG: peptidylprolyl isomerase [Pseudomonadaceae bacterium]|nr:peptidylprolyl isomerase [Pseudomonadaceae bacterium]